MKKIYWRLHFTCDEFLLLILIKLCCVISYLSFSFSNHIRKTSLREEASNLGTHVSGYSRNINFFGLKISPSPYIFHSGERIQNIRIRRMGVDRNRTRKEKVADSKISGYVRTEPYVMSKGEMATWLYLVTSKRFSSTRTRKQKASSNKTRPFWRVFSNTPRSSVNDIKLRFQCLVWTLPLYLQANPLDPWHRKLKLHLQTWK